MYNGIGVQTARGTGTSGHVMRNLSTIRPVRNDMRRRKETSEQANSSREVDPGIVHHNSLRRTEVLLMEFRGQLEDEGFSDDEIQSRVETRRKELREAGALAERIALEVTKEQQPAESHERSTDKQPERSDRSRSRSRKPVRRRRRASSSVSSVSSDASPRNSRRR